ncbi:SAM-dependent methyltransferase [Streptomyces scabiei]|uniref:SAM-dependent methyltransferase n=2 Tax=Streptomyces scabiei TaxID=1930 RepID=UPI001B3311F2|nr:MULTISPECIES: SAM-dependent methyltransferase [Streptomyces]MDX2689821.1 SAM-dependent methyltransferase [Streptomyces scabiei]MDX2754309.1 SAM-dependent methyltransferase [Streptomyces scabiei]MDX2809438.1 SAM-dependent methyltransferase [Streptomyces scabiei]MDX3125470.1 SAM-dependent methyltransferase [Streptomyces scabiei]MDX3217404.1 SAM-dependent methyltransferase [Streptomyces scabiei]
MNGSPPVEIDTSRPHPARMYDWYLGGKDNYPVDEAMGRQMLALDPRVPVMAQVNRAFMHRSTRWLAENGVRQFLDIGTGIPTEPNLHQVAQRVAPDATVVYCDNDPIVLAHAAALLRGTPQGRTEYLQADVRDPHAIIEGAAKVLDLTRPVALSLIALLHFVPDQDGAHTLLRRLMSHLPSGSYLVVTHATADFTPEESKAATEKLKAAGVTLALRSREEFTRFFDGLELIDPGVEVPQHWHPELGEPVPGQDDGIIPGYGAVARKP